MLAFDFEHFLTNLSFVSLLFLLVFHWAHASFFLNPIIGLYGMGVANIALTLLLLIRWVTSSHFPLSNLYESLLFLSWSFYRPSSSIAKKQSFSFSWTNNNTDGPFYKRLRYLYSSTRDATGDRTRSGPPIQLVNDACNHYDC